MVNTAVRRLGGSLSVDTRLGRGTDFTIRLPATLAIGHALMVRVGGQIYALALAGVEGVVRLSDQQLEAAQAADPPALVQYGQTYPMLRLGPLLGHEDTGLHRDGGRFSAILGRSGERRMAFLLDSVSGREEIVVKPVGPQVASASKGRVHIKPRLLFSAV